MRDSLLNHTLSTVGEILATSSIFGLILYSQIYLKIHQRIIFLFIPCCIVCLLFYGGMLGYLHETKLALQFIGNLCIIFLIIKYFDKLFVSLKVIWYTYQYRLFILGTIFLFVLTRLPQYEMLISFDDIGHWARTTKLISLNQHLIMADDSLGVKTYPPGIALFQYYFGILTPISHIGMFYAQSIFVLCTLTPIASNANANGQQKICANLLFIFIVLGTFNIAFHSLNGDLWVACLWGAGLAAYYFSPRRSLATILFTCPIIICLFLFKEIGLFFGLTFIVYIAVDQLVRRKFSLDFLLAIGALIFISLLLVCTAFWWQRHASVLQDIAVFPLNYSALNVWNAVASPTETQQSIIIGFVKRLLPVFQDLNGDLVFSSFFYITVILLALSYTILARQNLAYLRMRSLLRAVFFPFLLYVLAHLYLYLFSFGVGEALGLASFDRYMNIFFVGWFVILYALNSNTRSNPAAHLNAPVVSSEPPLNNYILMLCIFSVYRPYAWLLPICFIFIFVIFKYTSSRLYSLRFLLLSGFVTALVVVATIWRLYMVNIFYATNENLIYTSSTSTAVLTYLGAERKYSRIYTIWQDTNGQDYHQFTYNILPVKSNIRCWSIGRNYGHHDSWSCPKDPAVWSKELASYDYVFLGKIDKQFIEQFSELFEGGRVDAGNLYQVVTTGEVTTLRGVSYLNK